MSNLYSPFSFLNRHVGPSPKEQATMLETLKLSTRAELIEKTVPSSILGQEKLAIPEGLSEVEMIEHLKELASKNQIVNSFIGQGYYGTITPPVILRNILENPGWYTAYTPYQAEIAQGRLEMLLNFQTMIIDLTGMDLANASLLDEATAAAEAANMFYNLSRRKKKTANTLVCFGQVFQQTIDVVEVRAQALGLSVLYTDDINEIPWDETFGLLLQSPDAKGIIRDSSELLNLCKTNNVYTCFIADILALTLLEAPGQLGADCVVGSTQRFGVPIAFGGPHAAFFATKDEFKRSIPGRLIGISKDSSGQPAYRMALQTREQHIRRDKATSNICTSQVLLAVTAAAYAVYHGPKRLQLIAEKTHGLAVQFQKWLVNSDIEIIEGLIFDTVTFKVPKALELQSALNAKNINVWVNSQNEVQVSFDETKSETDLNKLCEEIAHHLALEPNLEFKQIDSLIPLRSTEFLQHPNFNTYHSEHGMLRYLKRLENSDLSLTHSMISLGSCTMKLNATVEMEAITWPEFTNIHPFAPQNQSLGYRELIKNFEALLAETTGFDAISLQPNSGAQGEFAGLLAIKNFHLENGESSRNIALIPSSAHGTNPASAVLAGMKVIVVKCDENGNIDVNDLNEKSKKYADTLSCLMVTYPSTHGVFEKEITEICKTIHSFGGQVYMDGANLNAQLGITSPGFIGADVCHLNLHKTFAIPHGGGGPGIGPIGVSKHLIPFLPGHSYEADLKSKRTKAVSAAPYGSAGVLPISYAYVKLMGGEGLREATEIAILNANYIMTALSTHYPILYTGENGFCAHEFILDCREFKASTGIQVEDIAKRLMDFGFHSPTVSFPVPGTLMIEPTESEPKAELDRFIDAMIAIRNEINNIETGIWTSSNNPLINAPHTAECLTEDWNYLYSREVAVYPVSWVKSQKFWPSVRRIDSAHGDRNLFCSCLPIDEYS